MRELIDYCSGQIDAITQYKVIDKYYYLQRFSQAKLEGLLDTFGDLQ